MEISINQARASIERVLAAQLVPLLRGSPAIGKSSLIHQIAKTYSLKVIDLRLSQCDPTDLMGFPHVCPKTGRGTYIPMDTFPLAGDKIPDGYEGWLLFLDELTSANRDVQAASYKVILDRMVGQKKLHENVVIAAAGNREEDGAIVEEMSTALQSRLVHLDLVVDVKEWLDWATTAGIDHRITSYIKWKPEILYSFKPDHTDLTYASPRTWEFASRIIKGTQGPVSMDYSPDLGGTLSDGVAREFILYTKLYRDLITIPEILKAPETVHVPEEPSLLFALTGTIAHGVNPQNIDKLMVFVGRLPIEFQVTTMREIVRRNQSLLENRAVQHWVTKNACELF